MIFLPFLDSSWSALITAQVLALFIDRLVGEPIRFHPLVGFGKFVSTLESVLNQQTSSRLKARGFLAWLLAIVPIVLGSYLLLFAALHISAILFWSVSIAALYLCIGLRSLELHAQQVAKPIAKYEEQGDLRDLVQARTMVSWLVSRNTSQMNETQINKACIESVLENGSDAVYGSLFWFIIAGAPGALMHRLVNTLDASWGYRSKRYKDFGWWSARADDWLNLLPARICALAYSRCGNWRNALESWQRIADWRISERRDQHTNLSSPNAGIVMASGAGALNLSLGGPAIYDEVSVSKPNLGAGNDPEANDIYRSITLVKRSLILFISVQILVYAVFRVGLWVAP